MTDDVSPSTKSNRQILYQYGRDAKLKDFKLRHNKLIHETGTFEVYNGNVVESMGVYQQHLDNQKIVLPGTPMELAPSTNPNNANNGQNAGSGVSGGNRNQNQRRRNSNYRKPSQHSAASANAPLLPQGHQVQSFLTLPNSQLMGNSQVSYASNNSVGWQPPSQQQQLVHQQQYITSQQVQSQRGSARMPPPTLPSYPAAHYQQRPSTSTNFSQSQQTSNVVNEPNKCTINANITLVPAMKNLHIFNYYAKNSPITSSPIKSAEYDDDEELMTSQIGSLSTSHGSTNLNSRIEMTSIFTKSYQHTMSLSLSVPSPTSVLDDARVANSISRFIQDFQNNKNPYASPFEKQFDIPSMNKPPSPILKHLAWSDDSD